MTPPQVLAPPAMNPPAEPEPENESVAVEILSDEDNDDHRDDGGYHTYSYRGHYAKDEDYEDKQQSWSSSYCYRKSHETHESWEEDRWGKWEGNSSASSPWK